MRVEELGLEVSGELVVKVGYKFQLSTGFWDEYTRDKFGYILTHKSSNGYWSEHTRDNFGNVLTYKNSRGYWTETTRDEFGRELSYECGNSNSNSKINK
jgi:hypothetical protein